MPACTTFGCPHPIVGLTSILALIRFWHRLELLLKSEGKETVYINHTRMSWMQQNPNKHKQHLLAIRGNLSVWKKMILALHQPASLFWSPGCSWFQGDCQDEVVCCLCTSCRWQQERSVCLYSGAQLKILSWLFLGPHMMVHVAALSM